MTIKLQFRGMKFRWVIALLQLFWLLANGYTIEEGDTDLIKNFTNNGDIYTIHLQENNHIEGSDYLLLFTIKGVPSEPQWKFGPASFTYENKLVDGSSLQNYEFYITQFMDYETESFHSYFITCIIDNSLISIALNTINYDDESPNLTAFMCSMDENTDYLEQNTTCTSTLSDPDGWLPLTNFTIVNSNPSASNELEQENKVFHIDFDRKIGDTIYNTTVYLTTLMKLDYETKIFYSFIVNAKDGAGHSTIPNKDVTCIVDVEDLNDMPPQWTDYFSTKEIWEEATYNFTVTAVDGDKKINAGIEYSLLAYDEDICEGSCITVTTEGKNGIIIVNPIDRDAKNLITYSFTIMAQEKDDPPFNTTLVIKLFVNDIDDNSPLFMNYTPNTDTNMKIAEFFFLENFAETVDKNIFIQDIDTGENAQFDVKLNEDSARENIHTEYTEAFLIVPTAGYREGDFQLTVKNNTYLDFENQPWQNFSFYVYSSGNNLSKVDDLLVKIHLIDYNDELPKFELDSYSTAVNETIKKGEEIIIVKATDRDAEDVVLTHQLVGAETITSLMEIDNNGSITVATENAFDYDRTNPVIFQVQAVDKVQHTTTVTVAVTLLDINNKAPTYNLRDVIRVDENQNIGIPLNATITASDVDTTRNLTAEINWEKSYAMKNSQKLNTSNPDLLRAMQFLNVSYEKTSVDTISIKLIVNENNDEKTAPDYETFDTLYLNITITDLNTDPDFEDQKSIGALIVIYINDINDNPPKFTENTLKKNRTIYERSDIGAMVGTIEAIDADVGDNVTYSCTYIVEEQDWFACDEYGTITVKSEDIDADTDLIDYVAINCTATDGFFNTSQNFSIYILDRNNKYPQILMPAVVEVDEKSDKGFEFGFINTTDADRDVPFHNVNCWISRMSNDECADSFVIVGKNVLTVLQGGTDLDRDTKKKTYNCTATCYDNPGFEQNQNSNETSFTIKLRDINDHCPDMQTSELMGSEGLFMNESIGLIVADDLDDGNNSEIQMEILTVTKHEDDQTDLNYTDQELFVMFFQEKDYRINSTRKQWHLRANKNLRDHYGDYTLQLQLNDLGTPKQQSTEGPNNTVYKEHAKLHLTIKRYNYYPPIFIFPNESKLNFLLSADQDPGKPLALYFSNETFGDIEIMDGNEEDPCLSKWQPEFSVELIDADNTERASQTNFFIIENPDGCKGQLRIDNTYKKRSDPVTYKVRINATLDHVERSEGESNYSVSVYLQLSFMDETDDPVFNSTLGLWNISFLEANISQEIEMKERKAYYSNAVDTYNIPIYYFMITEDEIISDTFEIEEATGTVKLKKELDYLDKIYYEFEIQASRNRSPVSSKSKSRMSVTVNVIDINNHVPQWTQDSFYGAFLRSSQKGSTVLTINATDLDTIDRDNLSYTLDSDIQPTGSNIYEVKEAFLVNEKTGAVTLNFQVDYNMNGYFFFWVKVQDAKDIYDNGPYENRTTVTIHIVADDNTVTFKFENPLDTVIRQKTECLQTISTTLEWSCQEQNIDKDSENGVTLDNVTAANIYCMENNTLLTANDVKTKLNNINTFQQLKQGLLKYGILLQNFNSNTSNVVNLESSLKAALIGVSVVLGAMSLILGVTFFLKTRELNRRLKKLTQQKFGSDESALNRKGINVPTTNMYATEGANPVFNTEVYKGDLSRALSIRSGNSDLVGIEDNPEFDDMFGNERY